MTSLVSRFVRIKKPITGLLFAVSPASQAQLSVRNQLQL